jgi:hypothetical protein
LWVVFGETNLQGVQSSKVGRPFFAWHTALPQEQIGRTVVVFGSTGVEAVGVVFAWAKGVVGREGLGCCTSRWHLALRKTWSFGGRGSTWLKLSSKGGFVLTPCFSFGT